MAADATTVLITGHAGFTGRHLVAHLRGCGDVGRIVGADLVAARGGGPVDEEFVGNLADFDISAHVLHAARPSHIVHLAGRLPPASDVELWVGNVELTATLLEAVRQMTPRARVVVIGSAAEYGPAEALPLAETHPCRPATPYGCAKLAQTELCQRYARDLGVAVMVARPFNLFGPHMPARTVIGELCARIAAAEPGGVIAAGNLDTARDFVDVRDAVAAYWALATRGRAGEVYNVCTGRAMPVRTVIATLIDLAGKDLRVESQPAHFQPGDVAASRGDPSKLQAELGISCPRDLRASLRETLAAAF